MLVEAMTFEDRFRAVMFIMGHPPYSIATPDRREVVALTYAWQRPHFYAIDRTDLGSGISVLGGAGGRLAPIFTFISAGELVGALVCSSPCGGYPLRGQMLAVCENRRSEGIAAELIDEALEAAPIVGVAPPASQRRRYQDMGLHWIEGAQGPVGFTRRVGRDRLAFAVPVTDPMELNEARQMARDAGLLRTD